MDTKSEIIQNTLLPNNKDLFDVLINLTKSKNLKFRHNVTSINGKDGYHRYVLLDPSISSSKDISIRSKNCIYYTESRFSKYHKPSIIGERKAINNLIAFLKTI